MKNRLQPSPTGFSLPDMVRETAAWVASNADFVSLNEGRIADYTAMLLGKYPLITGLDPQHHFLSQASPAATAAYVLALDSLNFGSGYFRIAQEHGIPLEYNYVAAALKKAFAESRLNTPQKWAVTTPAECHDIFCIPQEKDTQLSELMELFARHLQVTGAMIVSEYNGSILALMNSCDNSAVKLAETVAAWPTFRDVATYKGREVPFFKRAQILAADMLLAFQGKAPAAFADMDRLTNFPDNMVPHVLRCDGIVEYVPALAAKIDNGVMLEAGSAGETEVRAAGIHAVELMKAAALQMGKQVTSVNLDHILWNRGYEPDIYAKPSHRTMTVWY